MRLIDRLAKPRTIHWMLAALIALVVGALVLATVAIVREIRTAGRVDQVNDRVTFIETPVTPTKAQTRRALDRAISSLTIPQRRKLLDRLLGAATLEQLKRIRVRAKVVTRKRAARARAAPVGPVVRRSPARGRVPRPKPPAPPPVVVIPAPAPPPPPVLPSPALTPTPDGPGKHGKGKAKGHKKK